MQIMSHPNIETPQLLTQKTKEVDNGKKLRLF